VNASAPADDPVIGFYDSDYPSATHNPCPENFDDVTDFQGIRHDVARYESLAEGIEGDVLELCCGTGRIALPLAARGHRVTAVDVSTGMLEGLRSNMQRWPRDVGERVHLVQQDVCQLDLARRDYALCIIGFNSLLLVLGLEDQRVVLDRVAQHLRPGGDLLIDVLNPLQLELGGSLQPKPFFTRTHTVTGQRYTRFAMADPLDERQCQRLHGWYDEIGPDRQVRRTHYSMRWRPIFRFELELMLETAGFTITSIEGGHRNEPFRADSPRLFTRARKMAAPAQP
jgi:SAM-dependent methyltransferase